MKAEEIRQTASFAASAEEVYEAYVDPKKHAEFTGSPASGTPKVGGKFRTWDGYSFGKYLTLEKGKKIVHEWATTDWPAGFPASTVEIVLKPRGKKTDLVFVQTGVPSEQAEDYARGWRDYYWAPLKKFLEEK